MRCPVSIIQSISILNGNLTKRNVSTRLTKPIIIKPAPSSVTLSLGVEDIRGNKKWEPQYKGEEI